MDEQRRGGRPRSTRQVAPRRPSLTQPPPWTGRESAAVAAGVLLSASVAAELAWTVQRARRPVCYTRRSHLVAWTAGTVALVDALPGRWAPCSARSPRRADRSGDRPWPVPSSSSFGLVGLVTGLAGGAQQSGVPVFAVGLLLILVGLVPLALELHRVSGLGGWWVTVLVAKAGALVIGCRRRPWTTSAVRLLRHLGRPRPTAPRAGTGPAGPGTGEA